MSTEAAAGYKLNKKLKLAIRKHQTSIERKNKGTDDDHSGRKRGTSGYRKSKTTVTDRNRKRVYAVDDVISDNNVERQSFSKKGYSKAKADISNEKRNLGDPRTIWTEQKKTPLKPMKAGEAASYSLSKTKGKEANGAPKKSFQKETYSLKHRDQSEKSQDDQLKNKTYTKDSNLKRYSDQSQRKFQDPKRVFSDRKQLDDSARQDEQPKKKKRGIRIDPYDTSNKRLDDGMDYDGSIKEKIKDTEKSDEVSKNAQFRAIRPSPSILSYVEENFLGRRRLIELRRAGYNIELPAPLDNVPFSTSTDRERIEENVFRNNLTFFAAAKVSSSFPPPDVPEIAFAGRSNVGKSSLLNSLTRQWGVVRTSDKPGLTQTINFFDLGPKLRLVDLPGYGFAYAKEEVKDAWEELVKEYVSTRAGLKQVCLLIDTKWGMKPRDHELINLMERSKTKYQIVLTKTDVVFPIDVARRAMQIEEGLKAHKSIVQPLMMVSSKSGAGIRSLRTVLAKFARFTKL